MYKDSNFDPSLHDKTGYGQVGTHIIILTALNCMDSCLLIYTSPMKRVVIQVKTGY